MAKKIKISSRKVNVYYGKKKALNNINLNIHEKKVTSLIGPSGCGKSTFLRCLNSCLLYTSPSPRDGW